MSTDKLALLRAMAAKSTKTLAAQGKTLVEKTRNGENCFNLQCVVLSRYDGAAGSNGKKGPTRFNLVVVHPSTKDPALTSVSVPIEKEAGGLSTVETNQRLHLSSFQVARPETLVFGTLVQICGLSAVRLNDQLYYSAKKVKLLESQKYDLLDSLPPTFYHLGPPSTVDRNESAVLRFRGTPPVITEDAGAVTVFTLPDDTSHYVHETEEGDREVALKVDFSVMQWGGGLSSPQRVLVSTRLYENHLDGIGIMDPDTWIHVAPSVMKTLHGYVPGYLHAESTSELDINTISPSDEFDFGLVFKGLWNASTWDHRRFLTQSALEVSAAFVQGVLGDANASAFGSKNVLNAGASDVRNLSEFDGDLTAFYRMEGARFYVVSNHSLDAEDLAQVQGLEVAQREDCLHKKPGCPLKIHYEGRKTWVLFCALNPVVGEKRRVA